MKTILITVFFLTSFLFAQELQVKANKFNADEQAGISSFEGNVNIIKGNDELNASNVIVYTNKEHKPEKYVASGDVTFNLESKNGAKYKGIAQKVVYLPFKKEYHFYKDVHLKQVDEKKEIIGDEVILKVIEGKAYAKGEKSEPVIMIFDLPKDKEE